MIETARLLLPIFTRELMLLSAADPQAIRPVLATSIPGVSVDPHWPNASYAEALHFIAGLLASEPTLEPWMRLIVQRDTNTVIGEIGFKYLPTNPQAPGKTEIGYGIVPSARGQGFATEALNAMCAWGFENGATRIDADCLWDNLKSAAVLSRAGFHEWRGDSELRYWMKRRT